MNRRKGSKIISALLAVQMALTAVPQPAMTVNAEEYMYMHETFENMNAWTDTEGNASVVTDDDGSYLRFKLTGNDSEVYRDMPKGVSLADNDVYVVEFDVRFEDESSGEVLVYGRGKKLGPTLSFDGSKIKAQTGKVDYVTMRSDAKAGEWYDVKLLANGLKTVYSYTTNLSGNATTEESPKSVARNMTVSPFGRISLKGNSKTGAVDIRDLKVYKPEPTEVNMSVDGDVENVSLPAPGTTRTVNYLVSSTAYNGIDLLQYQPLASGLVHFCLYDGENETNLTNNMPEGVMLGSTSGALTISDNAQPGEYTVRLCSYGEAVYDSRKITIAEAGDIKSISLLDNIDKLPVPNNGTVNTVFKAQGYDLAGGEVYDAELKWSLLDAEGNVLNDEGITIDEKTGVVSTTAKAAAEAIKVRVEVIGNPEINAVSEAISTYKMEAKKITISGADYLQTSADKEATSEYTATVLDQNGVEMPKEEISSWEIENANDAITIADGILKAQPGADDAVVKVKVSAGDAMASKEVIVYAPELTRIEIDGDRSIEIPKSGTKSFAYTAKAYDQNDFEIESAAFEWEMTADDNTSLTFDDSTVTATTGAKEQTVTILAISGEVSGEYKVVVTENPFTYKPVDGGFEIDNGNKNYTRPIYAPHINDQGKTSFRYLYYLGDKPKLVLSNAGTSSFKRFGHMFLGIKGMKWLDEMKNITSRYVYGHEEYEITDPSFEGKIKLTYTRSEKLDAMLVKVELPDSLKDKLVVATAGQGGAAGAQPVGGVSSKLEFAASDTAPTNAVVNGNEFSISGNADATISGTSNIAMNYTVKDAAMYEVGVDALLASKVATQPMVVGTTEGNTENTVYLLMTVEDTSNSYFNEYQTNPKEIFNDGISYYKSVSETIKIDTPDPYIDAAMTSQVMAMDNIWDDPVITHGAIGWHNGQGGWRGGYCFVNAGWSDRIKTNIRHYIDNQNDDGRIWAYPTHDGRYNMSLVMVDIIMQYWDWTGDDAFFANEGGYEFIAGHLKFMDTYMQVPGTNLYENWLDAWNTDNKWNNGGAGSIATAYTWRAYNTMAKIAAKIGKTDDAVAYQTKADAIKAEMNEQLWDSDTGVFGEVRERFGLGRLNAAPDLSSVYTPIDMGIATPEQEYQMLRFTDYAVPSVANQDSIWKNIDFKYSSNRLPEYYSSDGLYIEEVINNALAYFENGQREMAMKQFRACLVPLMKGSAAGQGVAGHIVRSSLENNGHIDFADATSQYARTAMEGLFGIKMNVPEGKANITPGFPEDWKYASIESSTLSYDFKYENNTDIFNISSEKELSYVMHIPARSSKIESVTVNGNAVEFTVDSFVNFATPISDNAEVAVRYADSEIAKTEAEEIGGTNSEYTVKSNGTITNISDPQGVLAEIPQLDSAEISVKLGEKTGHHTFFVTVKKDDMTAILPIDLEIRSGIEITDAKLVTGANAGISVKLTNNTEKQVTLNAVLSTVSGEVTKDVTVKAKSSSEAMLVPLENVTDVTPGNNKITAVLSGDVEGTISAELTDWQLKDKVSNTDEQYQMISLDDSVNQDLRTLHKNTYDITYEGDEHYRLPNFYWSSDSPRTALPNGRTWWEPNRGESGVPASLSLPENGGVYKTDIGVPFDISSKDGNNAAFVSLYNQFPDKMNIPVNTAGSKIYFMLSVSTNNMQSRIKNARITVNTKDGTKEVLSLTNPDNIDDWLNYQQTNPYAQSGYVQMFGEKAHSNILAVDLGSVKMIESIDFECLASEVLAGLLGVTVVKGEYTEPEPTNTPEPDNTPEPTEVPEGIIIADFGFSKSEVDGTTKVTANATVTNYTSDTVEAEIIIVHFDSSGRIKSISSSNVADSSYKYSVTSNTDFIEGDYVKAFIWDSISKMNPMTNAKVFTY